ncbi:MAG: septum formation initiator family protein [Rhodobacteraceae bacterium]|nr:septum formation initiator family protein [Paracoccaceae bacterium]
MLRRGRPALGALFYIFLMGLLGLYFAFAAVQGNFGLFRRAELNSEVRALSDELAMLNAEMSEMENLTHRLSDDYLDLDLLDEQARNVLGMIRADEMIIR